MLSRLARQEREALVWRQTVEPLLWGLFSVLGAEYAESEPDFFKHDTIEILDRIRAVLGELQEGE